MCSDIYREQVQKVLVGLKGRREAMDGQQLVDVAVKMLQLAQVDLVLVDVVRQRLVERDQVLKVDAQDGHLETAALTVDSAVVAVVAAGREQLGHLAQGLEKVRSQESEVTVKTLSVCRLV